jgi:hypothetical protein
MDHAPNLTRPQPSVLLTILIVLGLVGGGYLIARFVDRREQSEVQQSSIDEIVVALREQRNRLEVYRLSGNVTSAAQATRGPGGILAGTMKVRQPWSVAYFGDMGDLSLNDYIWDERTRTLIVRAPAIRPDAPNIDESRQLVAYEGPFITRSMQTELRSKVARNAVGQANAEALKPENLAAADRAARAQIAANLEGPLRAVGVRDVRIQVVPRQPASDGERWDVSRSIAEVLAERAAR